MNLLLDTHTLIWFLNGDKDAISKKARAVIEKRENVKFVSIASCWEIAIKLSLGKLRFEGTFSELKEEINNSGFIILPITFEHTLKLINLKFYHRDPFDRLLVAQAIEEEMIIITKDEFIPQYKVKTIW